MKQKETQKLILGVELQEAAKSGHTDRREFLKTIFGVRSTRGGYEFYVIDQYFRPAPTS